MKYVLQHFNLTTNLWDSNTLFNVLDACPIVYDSYETANESLVKLLQTEAHPVISINGVLQPPYRIIEVE